MVEIEQDPIELAIEDPVETVYQISVNKDGIRKCMEEDIPEKPKNNKIQGSDYEREVVRLLSLKIGPYNVSKSLQERLGIRVDPTTVRQYRDYYYPERVKVFEEKEKRLIKNADTTIEYFEELVKIREERVIMLRELMEATKFNPSVESLISNHLSAIQSLKDTLYKMTGGIDEIKKKNMIIGEVAAIGVRCFLPYISDFQRYEVIKVFRKEIMKYAQEMC